MTDPAVWVSLLLICRLAGGAPKGADRRAGSDLIAPDRNSPITVPSASPIAIRLQAVAPGRRVIGVCAAFHIGSSALLPDGSSSGAHRAVPPVESLVATDDPAGWHRLPDAQGVSMRRARRIDCWRSTSEVVIDAIFQDSSTGPDGVRRAVQSTELRLASMPPRVDWRHCRPGHARCPITSAR